MTMGRALAIAACGWLVTSMPAAAQFQPAAPAAGQEPPCMKEFGRLRDDARKKAGFIEAAGKRENKPTAQEALWFQGGNLALSRFFSKFLALQIKARMEGISTPVYQTFF